MQKQDRGRLRWRRAVPLFLPAGLGMLLMAAFLFIGWMPLNLAIKGQDVKLTSNGRSGSAPGGLLAYADLTQMKNGGDKVPTLIAQIPEAKLNGLCMSMNLTFPVIGSWTVQLHSTKEVVIHNLRAAAADAHLVNAVLAAETDDGKPVNKDSSNLVSGVELNKDAATIDGVDGGVGIMGVEGHGPLTFSELQANAKSAGLYGRATLTGLGIPKFGHGKGVEHHECY